MSPTPEYQDFLNTPIGILRITASDAALTGVCFVEVDSQSKRNRITDTARQQLDEYFKHGRTEFDIVLHADGTDFQMSCWQALQQIPYGQTQSYSELAQRIGRPKAVRAVGAANGRNAIGIIVPCHRVIGADGSLTGFAHGVERKAWLLKHETHTCAKITV